MNTEPLSQVRGYQYEFDKSLDVDYRDKGPWRSYHIASYGDSLEEVLVNAIVYECSESGDEINNYDVEQAPVEVVMQIYKVIETEIIRVAQMRDRN